MLDCSCLKQAQTDVIEMGNANYKDTANKNAKQSRFVFDMHECHITKRRNGYYSA